MYTYGEERGMRRESEQILGGKRKGREGCISWEGRERRKIFSFILIIFIYLGKDYINY